MAAFERTIPREHWDVADSRVEFSTSRVLDLFGSRGVKGTFFVLGWIAERHPALVKRIVAEGTNLPAMAMTTPACINRHANSLRRTSFEPRLFLKTWPGWRSGATAHRAIPSMERTSGRSMCSRKRATSTVRAFTRPARSLWNAGSTALPIPVSARWHSRSSGNDCFRRQQQFTLRWRRLLPPPALSHCFVGRCAG